MKTTKNDSTAETIISAETSLKIGMFLQMRFADGSGEDLQVDLAHAEIMSIVEQALASQHESDIQAFEKMLKDEDVKITEELKRKAGRIYEVNQGTIGFEDIIDAIIAPRKIRNQLRAELRQKLKEMR